MGQLSGTNALIFEVPGKAKLSRYRDKTGTKTGTNEMAEFCRFSSRDKTPGRISGQGWDNGTSGTKGFSLVPLVPAHPRGVLVRVGQ